MKKLLVSLAAILLTLGAWAVPAKPGAFNYTQPDGSVVRLELHGDEFFSWTTLAGTDQVVKLDADGFWRNTTLDPVAQEAAAQFRRQVNLQRSSLQPRTHDESYIMTHGTRHIPVLLVNFQDVAFSLDNPNERFNALLNQHGYADNGATGSAHDYFNDNSHGQFDPIFDVYGPVTLPHEMKYYGEPVKDDSGRITHNDKQPEIAVYDAAVLLDSSVDFSQYDVDNDGDVDMVLIYYAGYNQAEGAHENTIWPHQWSVQGSSSAEARNATFDGLKLSKYFMTSELKGIEGVNMCGIGTTCHEFGHSLGLPDFYDTDYDNNGYDHGLSYFSIMSGGNYLNDGCTPPYYNAEERIYLGWMIESDLQKLPQGAISFGSVKDDIAYITPTDTDGEYFLYECRDGSGWDAYIARGLLVYHVDKSTVRVVGGMTPYKQWKDWSHYNTINAYGDHPCFYIIPASDQTNLKYASTNLGSWVFPGSSNVTSYVPIDWEGNDTGVSITSISYADGKVSLNANYSTDKLIIGQVTDSAGNAVEGVKVTLSQKSDPANGPRIRGIKPRTVAFEVITDATGSYQISINEFPAEEGHLSFLKEGYQIIGVDVSLTKRITTVNVKMFKEGEDEVRDFRYYDPTAGYYYSGVESLGNSQMASIRIPASELRYGGVVGGIEFWPYFNADAYYIVIDSGKERIFTGRINGLTEGIKQLARINLSELAITFPEGEDLYVGIAVKNAVPEYNGYLFITSAGGSNTYFSEFNLESSNWAYKEEGYGLVLTATLSLFTTPQEELTSFAQMGIASIADPGCGSYKAGDVFQLKMELPEGAKAQVSWKFDGLTVTDPVTLQTGKHTVTAILNYEDGSVETLDLLIEVK